MSFIENMEAKQGQKGNNKNLQKRVSINCAIIKSKEKTDLIKKLFFTPTKNTYTQHSENLKEKLIA